MGAVTLDRLAEGIRRANAAGDVDTVRKLGVAYRQMQAQGQQPPVEVVQLHGKVSELPSQQNYGSSHFAQGMSGLNEGIADIVGLPAQLANDYLVAPALGAVNAVAGTDLQASERPFLGQQHIRQMMGGAITPETEDPGKQIIRRMAKEVGAAAVPVLGTAGAVARPGAMIAKELAMSLGSGGGAAIAEQAAPDNAWAELAGQVLGAGSVAGATRLGKRVITPFPTSPERLAAAERLRDEGVELTAGQATGNKGLQYAESELGGSRAANLTERQAEQFTAAALGRAGVRSNRASPEVMDDAFSTIGQQFDDIAARSQMPLDHQLGLDLGDTIREYRQLVPESMRAPVVENFVIDLVHATQGGNVLPGTVYQALRSRLDRLARSSKNDPQLSDALFNIRNALDDSVERYLTQADPDTLGVWRQVRSDYRNLLVLEKAAQGGGEVAASGLISPARLSQAAQQVFGKRSHVRGRNDFSELAQAGQQTMSPLPQSGTAPRAAVTAIKGALPFAGAAIGGGGTLGLGAIAGAAAGAALPAAAGRAMLSGSGRRYLSNQLLAAPSAGGGGIGAVAAALADRTSDLPELTPGQDAVLRELIARNPMEITVRGGARVQ